MYPAGVSDVDAARAVGGRLVSPGERTDVPLSRAAPDVSGLTHRPGLDDASSAWLRELRSEGPAHDDAVGRLHALLLRVARAEAARRRPGLPDTIVSELDDICVQAASDGVVAILRKLDEFEGAARFTTWASKFVILELSSRVRRRAWRGREIASDPAVWERLTDDAPSAQQSLEYRQLLDVLGRAVEEDLSDRQRLVFSAAVLEEVPIDVLAERLGSTRGAVYKVVHDARSKLRGALLRAGHEEALA